MFTLVYALENFGPYDTFVEAFKEMYNKVKKDISEGEMSWQVLETMVWIEEKGRRNPIMFYEARDLAHENGFIDDKGNLLV
jgi:hypothetical protein